MLQVLVYTTNHILMVTLPPGFSVCSEPFTNIHYLLLIVLIPFIIFHYFKCYYSLPRSYYYLLVNTFPVTIAHTILLYSNIHYLQYYLAVAVII